MTQKSHSLDSAFDQPEVLVRNISHQNSYDYTSIHRHEYFEFILFDSGDGGKQTIDFEEYKIESKSLFIIVPDQVHLMVRKPSEKGLLIQFTRDFLALCINPFKVNFLQCLFGSPKLILTDDQFKNIYSLLNKLCVEIKQSKQYKYHRIKHLFGLLFFEILEIIPQANLLREKNCALEFLLAVEQRFKELRNVKKYAQIISVPLNKMTQDVKKQFSKSPLQIIHDITLIEIKRLLVVEKLSHKEIAFELNFDSQSSYSRFIKQKTTLTPGQLKKEVMQMAQQSV